MKSFWVLVLIVFILLPATSTAFDGNRKGFVLGGGLGFTPVATWTNEEPFEIDKSNAGVGLNLVIGYAWDEFNMIVYEGNVCGYRINDLDILQGFNGVSWYHYFGPKGKSFFTVAGIGLYVFDREQRETNEMGAAYMIGGGFEFTRHVQVGLYLSGGQTRTSYTDIGGSTLLGSDFDFGHNHISLLISAIAF